MKLWNKQLHIVWAAAVAVGLSGEVFGGLTTFEDRDAWFAAVGGATAVTTIGFDDFAVPTFITDQYQPLGVTFTDGNDITTGPDLDTWLQDGWGLDGNGDIDLLFDAPRTFIAVDHPGSMRFELFLDGQAVGDAFFATNGTGNFAGVISTIPFNSVVISDLVDGQVFIDDLHFTNIPGPSGFVILSGLLLMRSRRQRRDCMCATRPPNELYPRVIHGASDINAQVLPNRHVRNCRV